MCSLCIYFNCNLYSDICLRTVVLNSGDHLKYQTDNTKSTIILTLHFLIPFIMAMDTKCLIVITDTL